MIDIIGGLLRKQQFRLHKVLYQDLPDPESIKEDWAALVTETAKRYVGFQEKPGNKGWYDKAFEKGMRLIGFQTGHAWCAYFTEKVWFDSFMTLKDTKHLEGVKKLFSGSTQKTFANFKKHGEKYGFSIHHLPQPGDVVIWYNAKKTWQGHAAIVVAVLDNKKIITIEGNTNGSGSREGDGVFQKTRNVQKNGDLKLKGFIRTNF